MFPYNGVLSAFSELRLGRQYFQPWTETLADRGLRLDRIIMILST